jgi:hypothetical protein
MACLATAATTDNTLTLVKSTATISKLASGTLTAFCPAEFPVALAGSATPTAVCCLTRLGARLGYERIPRCWLTSPTDRQVRPRVASQALEQ